MTTHGDDPIRVFVGTSAEQRLALQVLAFSARRRTRRRVEVWPMDGRGLPVPRDPRNRGRTNFSFARFEIPRLCGYRGRALYLDADMLVLADLDELWSLPLDGADLLYSRQGPRGSGARFAVMLLDCAQLADWSAANVVEKLDAGGCTYEELLFELCLVPDARKRDAIPERWNSLDRHVPGETALLHYTSVPTQPWKFGGHVHGAVWYRELHDALASGAIDAADVAEEVRRGHVAPDLLAWARASAGAAPMQTGRGP